MSPLLEVIGIGVRFGGLAALENVSFALGEGELLGRPVAARRLPAGTRRHLPIVAGSDPNRAAICFFSRPSVAANTIWARRAKP